MAANRLPYFPFNVDDYLADEAVQSMDADAEGCYVRILCASWKSGTPGVVRADLIYKLAEGSRLAEQYRLWWDDERLGASGLPGLDLTPEAVGWERWKDVRDQLAAAFDTTSQDGAWIQKRMVVEFRRAKRTTDAQIRGGRKSAELRQLSKSPGGSLQAPSRHPSSIREVEVEGEVDKTKTQPGRQAAGGDSPSAQNGHDRATLLREWDEGFTDFWDAYPRPVKRADAMRAWRSLEPWDQPHLNAICAGLRRWVAFWKQRGIPPDKIPYPAAFLRGHQHESVPQ